MEPANIRKTLHGVPGWTSDGMATASPSGMPAFSEAMSQARARLPGAAESPYQAVLDDLKRQLAGSGRLNVAAYDQPSDDDFNLVRDLARGAIRAHDGKASSAGRALLAAGAEGDAAEHQDSDDDRRDEREVEQALAQASSSHRRSFGGAWDCIECCVRALGHSFGTASPCGARH